MAIAPLSDEICEEAVRVLRSNKNNIAAAARELNVARATMQHRLEQAARRGLYEKTQDPLPPGFAIKGTSALYRDGEKVLEWVKTKSEPSTEEVIQSLRSVFDEYEGKAKPIPAPKHTDAELLSVYPIADQHHGLLSWQPETGENYDLQIGADRLRNCASRLIAQSPPSRQAIIINLGDWTHQDDNKNMTPRSGNILDVDGRYFKVLTTGVQLMMDVIELALQKHQSVLVRNLPGNHDPHAAIALTVALASFYAKNPRVTIDTDPSDLFFYRFGATLIGANHGHKMRADRMAMSMATLRRKEWGETKYHWFLFGHIHHETVKEIGDCRVESFQTLAAKDAHAASSGYNSGQSLSSITIHKEDGEIGRHRINVPPPYMR